jgi:hypothetical protein
MSNYDPDLVSVTYGDGSPVGARGYCDETTLFCRNIQPRVAEFTLLNAHKYTDIDLFSDLNIRGVKFRIQSLKRDIATNRLHVKAVEIVEVSDG